MTREAAAAACHHEFDRNLGPRDMYFGSIYVEDVEVRFIPVQPMHNATRDDTGMWSTPGEFGRWAVLNGHSKFVRQRSTHKQTHIHVYPCKSIPLEMRTALANPDF